MTADEVVFRLGQQARGFAPTKRVDRVDKQLMLWDREEYDMLAALDRMGKYHALFADKLIVEDTLGLEIVDD